VQYWLNHWSKPFDIQNLYDCYLFAMGSISRDNRVIHTQRVEPEHADEKVPVGMSLRVTATTGMKEEHTGIHLGQGWYMSKQGFSNVYAITPIDAFHITVKCHQPMLSMTLISQICHNCEKLHPSLKRCGQCRAVHYCSPECQKADWIKQHKRECSKMFRMPDEKTMVQIKEENARLRVAWLEEQSRPPCKTQEQLLERLHILESKTERDFFGVRRAKLISYLEYKHAKPYLEAKVKEEDWKPVPCFRTLVLREMYEYMEFAWEKCIQKLKMQSNRNMDHFEEWLWIIGDTTEVWDTKVLPIKYTAYGRDRLIAICQHYRFEHSEYLEDGK
jgi:hypothetical protein